MEPLIDSSRVLIATGDLGLRQQIYKRLLGQNIVSDTAVDGPHALQQLATTPYSVVLLDIDLPVVPAERVVQALGRLPEQRRPVVLVLASSSAARSLDVHVVQIVLRKPLNLALIAEMVGSCIRVTGAPQVLPSSKDSAAEEPAA